MSIRMAALEAKKQGRLEEGTDPGREYFPPRAMTIMTPLRSLQPNRGSVRRFGYRDTSSFCAWRHQSGSTNNNNIIIIYTEPYVGISTFVPWGIEIDMDVFGWRLNGKKG